MMKGANIAAILLAAGESKRMGRPKLLLPWGATTVLGQVIAVFGDAGIEDIVVVTGGARRQIESLVETFVGKYPVRTVYNPGFAQGEMLSSLQCGLKALRPGTRATLIALGDQPQVEESTVRLVVAEFERTGAPLVVPSYDRRRGHPWLVARPLWGAIHALEPPCTARDFLDRHSEQITYVAAMSRSVIEDVDTREDYQRARPA